MMKAPGFALVDAVRYGRIYVISGDFYLGSQMIIGTVVVAKWLYPELFADMDPQEIHGEFLRDLWKSKLISPGLVPSSIHPSNDRGEAQPDDPQPAGERDSLTSPPFFHPALTSRLTVALCSTMEATM